MKSRASVWISMGLNAGLGIALWLVHSRNPDSQPAIRSAVAPPEIDVVSPTKLQGAPASPAVAFHWRAVESEDYHQYVANLRAIGCPEPTIRDIIVADIDQLYRTREQALETAAAPWHSGSRRRRDARAGVQARAQLASEKRALVKDLIGYEWDSWVAQLWHQDALNAVVLGFLPELKASQLMSLVSARQDESRAIHNASDGILIAEDRAALDRILNSLRRDVAALLGPAEREEWELRVQAGAFLPLEGVHWDGVTVNGAVLREFVRLSKDYRDAFAEEFLHPRPLAESEQTIRRTEFDRRVAALLGAQFDDFQRAQDQSFRDLLAFVTERQLPKESAIAVYDACRKAEARAAEFASDASLSSEEQAAALELLRVNTSKLIAERLGSSFADYLNGPGQWMAVLRAVDSLTAAQP